MAEGRVLVVEDDLVQREGVRLLLQGAALEVQAAATVAEATSLLERQRFEAILLDLVLSDGHGSAVLQFARERKLTAPIIIMTGYGGAATAEDCLAAGAFDYLCKPFGRLELLAVLRRALLWNGVLVQGDGDEPVVSPVPHFPFIIGRSNAMKEVLARIAKVAVTDTNVCVYGESGTGKELVARALHYCSHRADRPLIVFDCAAVPEGLMESELFGHVKGAFTSAVADRDGAFQLADGGSLFLDEIAELSLPLQAKLLRVIQSREFRKVGGGRSVKVDVRIICATNKDLAARVTQGEFREDLFYRLEVVPVTIPPLRERKEDIPVLVSHFIEKFNRNNRKQIRSVSSRTMGALLRYSWPGNVRELENCIERAAVMADKPVIDVEELGSLLRAGNGRVGPEPSKGDYQPRSLKEAERDHIIRTLEMVQGNRKHAAEVLGLSLRNLYYKLEQIQGAVSIAKDGTPPVS
jgi:DNA-binding NtrC family response regulator